MSLKDLSDSLGTKKEQPKQQEQKPFDNYNADKNYSYLIS